MIDKVGQLSVFGFFALTAVIRNFFLKDKFENDLNFLHKNDDIYTKK